MDPIWRKIITNPHVMTSLSVFVVCVLVNVCNITESKALKVSGAFATFILAVDVALAGTSTSVPANTHTETITTTTVDAQPTPPVPPKATP